MKEKKTCKVVSQTMVTKGIYDLRINVGSMAVEAKPGQFVALYSGDASRLLPRPISICEIFSSEGIIRLVYRIAGKGTEEFSHLSAGDEIEVMGPLGNGFTQGKGRAVLMGGGIGIPPMLELAKTLSLTAMPTVILGYRDSDCFLEKEFEPYADVIIATEDGSRGIKGNVIDAIRAAGTECDTIYACGPTPMLRGIKNYAEEQNITAYISMEEKMACGIGACLACVCKSKDTDAHTNVHNKRICKEGPVFDAREVEL